jgi:hypothetical protein
VLKIVRRQRFHATSIIVRTRPSNICRHRGISVLRNFLIANDSAVKLGWAPLHIFSNLGGLQSPARRAVKLLS